MVTIQTRDKYIAEYVGTAALMLVVAGSGIMGETLSPQNPAVALLANSMATGCGLYVLITLLGPISGAHFNPLVSLLFWRRSQVGAPSVVAYIVMQCLGAVSGVWLTHLIFSLPLIQSSTHLRDGVGIWVSELIASLMLLTIIHIGAKHHQEKLPLLVAFAVTGGYWFTSSTFFANPAITVARSLTDTFVGIAPISVIGFIGMQILALLIILFLVKRNA